MAHRYIGLSEEQVAESRRLHGANVLTPPKPESLWKRYFEKLSGPFGHLFKGCHDGDWLIFILEIAALLSIGVAWAEYYEWFGLKYSGIRVFVEPVGIITAISLATGIAFYFEVKADHEFSILNQARDDEQVKVVRSGNPTIIPRRDVVVGDVVLLTAGDEIPADGVLLKTSQLLVDESTLTGEPQSRKGLELPQDKETTYPSDTLLRGTKVIEGRATYQVTAVGDATEDGKLMHAVAIDNTIVTPLNSQLNRLGKQIAKASYIVAAIILIGRLFSFLHEASLLGALQSSDITNYVIESFMIVVTFIVMAVPEGLPMAVSLSLAYSMRQMFKQGNLVRRMHACETMGAATVICTDKTGTLTQNQMQVAFVSFFDRHIADADGIVAESIATNTTAHLTDKVIGNPTEGALLLWLRDAEVDYRTLRDSVTIEAEMPFSTERKMMATAVKRTDGTRRLYVKGAPEILLDICSDIDSDSSRREVLESLSKWQKRGMRTLGFAYKELSCDEIPIDGDKLAPEGLIFIGYVAISDPVRPDVPAAVKECMEAGIDVKIITGDTDGTAVEIGRQIGIVGIEVGANSVTTGREIAAMSDQELRSAIGSIKIIARARPLDKRRIVEALQANGEVVAVTGDGTNDAPALRAAHVGLSMGDGTAVAKEASDITILDNSFASITTAVMWGRSLYRNIQRFLLFQLTVNIVACITLLFGSFLGMQSPLTVTQMLWVNLIMDSFAAVAMASLPPLRSVMKAKPRSRYESILSRELRHHLLIAGIFLSLPLIILLYLLEYGLNVNDFIDLLSFKYGHHRIINAVEVTLFFTTFVMLQWWNMLAVRRFKAEGSEMSWRDSRVFIGMMGIILIGQILIVTFGGELFGVESMNLFKSWLPIMAVSAFVVWLSYLLRKLLTKKSD